MSTVTQDSLAVIALTNRLVDVGVPALKASELWRLLDRIDEPSRLVGLDARAIAGITQGIELDAERLARLLDTGVGLALRLDELYERGISALTVADERYPMRLRERLGPAAPPVLYCAGDISLLGVDGLGIVGSREVGPDAIAVTGKAAHEIASAGVTLVSGGAKGVDSIGMGAAYDAGGAVVGVLANGLDRAIVRHDHRAAVLEGRACLCTPYRPDAGFTAGAAMGRNKIIYGLSRVTLVVTCGAGEGGTWSGATEAIKQNYGRVAVWTGAGAGPGNVSLVRAGGTAIEQMENLLSLEPDPGGESQLVLDFESRAHGDP